MRRHSGRSASTLQYRFGNMTEGSDYGIYAGIGQSF
jgi:hypothetical protein